MLDAEARAHKRRVLIDLARKRQRAGAGSSARFVRERSSQMQFPDLSPTLSVRAAQFVWQVARALKTPV